MKTILKSHTLLYIEDDLNIQKNIAQYLSEYFKTIYLANDGKSGLSQYKKYKPDVLLLDIDLPYIDGLTLAKDIRAFDKNISIIILTAFSDKEKLLKATELRLLKYLIKPIDLISIEDTLNLLAKELLANSSKVLSLGEQYTWNILSSQLLHNELNIALTSKEQLLLNLLIKSRNHSVSFEDIMSVVWANDFEKEISYNCVKNIIVNLRKKLPKNSIKNIYGKGYLFQAVK